MRSVFSDSMSRAGVCGDRLRHRSRCTADAEEPPRHLLVGADLREGSVLRGINFDPQRLLVSCRLRHHTASQCWHWGPSGTFRRLPSAPTCCFETLGVCDLRVFLKAPTRKGATAVAVADTTG